MKFIFFLFFALLATAFGYGQQRKSQSEAPATIHGQIPGHPNETVKTYFWRKRFFNDYNIGVVYKEVITNANGEFTYVSPKFSGIARLLIVAPSIKVPYEKKKSPIGRDGIFIHNFLVEPHDDVTLDVNTNGIIFSGKGFEKYRLVFMIDTAQWHYKENEKKKQFINKPKVIHPEDIEKDASVLIKLLSPDRIKIQQIFDILNRFKKGVNNVIWQTLKCDYYSFEVDRTLEPLYSWWLDAFSAPDSIYRKKTIIDFVNQACGLQELQDLTVDAKYLSENYARCMIFIYRMNVQSEKNSIVNVDDDIYAKFDKQPQQLKDVLYGQFLIDARRRISGQTFTDQYFNSLIPKIHDPFVQDALIDMNSATADGRPAYNFNLLAMDGKQVSLTDLRGKVVLMDFWYTGCLACAISWKDLKVLEEKYKDNKDIVFVSICCDKDKKFWEESVNKEIYTSPVTAINLWARDKEHPMLKYYKLQSFPKLLLIGKDGNVFTYNAPRPDGPDGINQLSILLEKAVASK